MVSLVFLSRVVSNWQSLVGLNNSLSTLLKDKIIHLSERQVVLSLLITVVVDYKDQSVHKSIYRHAFIGNSPISLVNFCKNKLNLWTHTDRSDSQLSQVITKNYSNTPRVPMGIWGSVCDPRTQILGFGARPSIFKRTRTKKTLKKRQI